MDKYELADDGTWWCYTKRGRVRAPIRECAQCQKRFPCRHPQQFCSRACRAASQRGFRGAIRNCAWCKAPFHRNKRTTRRICCSSRCAYDLGNTKRGRKGPANGKWKGGVKSHATGYVREYDPERGYLLQHRIVMERVLGRRLKPGENVHHKNGVRDDNRPENLELWVRHQPPGQRVEEHRHCPSCTCKVNQ